MQPEITEFLYKAAASAVIGVIMAIVLWPFRKARKEWTALKEEQKLIHQELVTQRTNCLTTLQNQGDRQIELLGTMSTTLTGMALSQAEMTGYCKASACTPAVRRSIRKK